MDEAAQLSLCFERPAPGKADERALVAFLERRGWMTAAQISAATKWSDRAVRDIASHSDQVISYPGSPGYKLLRECTVEEFARAEAATASQVRHMTDRLVRMRNAYHGRAA